MTCNHCNSKWETNANISSTVCPFCGKSLVQEENPKFEDTKDALAYIMNKHGADVLLGEKLKAFFFRLCTVSFAEYKKIDLCRL